MNTTVNNVIITTYTGVKGELIHRKWDDGSMRRSSILFKGEQNGQYVQLRWHSITFFHFDGDTVEFEGKRSDDVLDSKRVHGVKLVEVK
jgi:hypothetical protein